MPDPVYFDSSVFLAIFMGEASGQSIKELLKELRRDKIRIYTSIITIQEVSVQTFRKRAAASDNYTKVNKLARIHGITKEIALTAAKLEAQVLDDTRPKDREENKQRKWDCFHLASAMELGCRTFYSLDDKQLARGKRFCAGVWFGKPAPRNLLLPLFPEPESEAKTNGKNSTADANGTSNTTATAESDQLKADPAHSAPVQGSDSGRAQGEAAGENSATATEGEGRKMTGAIIKQLPDTTNCAHKAFGLEGESGRMGNFDVGYCADCKFTIAFRLDQSGSRTGETQIVEIKEVQ